MASFLSTLSSKLKDGPFSHKGSDVKRDGSGQANAAKDPTICNQLPSTFPNTNHHARCMRVETRSIQTADIFLLISLGQLLPATSRCPNP